MVNFQRSLQTFLEHVLVDQTDVVLAVGVAVAAGEHLEPVANSSLADDLELLHSVASSQLDLRSPIRAV